MGCPETQPAFNSTCDVYQECVSSQIFLLMPIHLSAAGCVSTSWSISVPTTPWALDSHRQALPKQPISALLNNLTKTPNAVQIYPSRLPRMRDTEQKSSVHIISVAASHGPSGWAIRATIIVIDGMLATENKSWHASSTRGTCKQSQFPFDRWKGSRYPMASPTQPSTWDTAWQDLEKHAKLCFAKR